MTLPKLYTDRMKLSKTIRDFFTSRGFVEVETPLLVASPDLSVNLTHVVTQRHEALITSPEFSMKKLLGEGLEKIFTLTKVFRADEADTGQHLQEFTMLEWYEQGADYLTGMEQTEELVRACLKGTKCKMPQAPFQRLHLPTRFRQITGIDYADATVNELHATCRTLGLQTDASDSWSDLFHRIFVTRIEPQLGDVCFVYDFPKQQAALSVLTADRKYAQRFELYLYGLELCNAFTELTDATEQRARFEQELTERRRLGKETFPIDERLLSLLPSVRTPTFGNALGVDRLFMLASGIDDINDTQYGFSK